MINPSKYKASQLSDFLRAELLNVQAQLTSALSEIAADNYSHVIGIVRARFRLEDMLTKLLADGFTLNQVARSYADEYQAGDNFATEVVPSLQGMRTDLAAAAVWIKSNLPSHSVNDAGERKYDVAYSAADKKTLQDLISAVLAHYS